MAGSLLLFNGKDLSGWDFDEKYWCVRDGVIVGKNTEPVAVSTYCLTKRKFTDFRLTATVKLVESEMHSGISLWGRVIPPQHGETRAYAGHLVMFPSGWGIFDLKPDPEKPGAHCGRNLIFADPGRVARRAGNQHGWNELEILAKGDRLRVACNGILIADWRDPEPLGGPDHEGITAGPIGLQLHSNNVPQEVHFKDLLLEPFPPDDVLKTLKPRLANL